MGNKTFTFLITSNRKGETKSFTVSSSLLKIAGFLGVLLVALLVSMSIDYMGLLLESGENKRLLSENIRLKKQFDIIESKVNSLESSLDRVKNFSTKLQLITDIDAEDRTLRLSMGADKLSDKLPEEGNSNRDEGLGKDDVFLTNLPVNNKQGELARDDFKNYATLSIKIDKALKNSKLTEVSSEDIWNSLKGKKDLMKSMPSLKPTKGWYTSKFGYRMDPFSGKPIMYNGVDIAAPEGTKVIAPADGVVSYVGYDNVKGKVVTIDHGYGVKTSYAHNSEIFVEIGDNISRRDKIASVGTTGRVQGSHLYYEIRVHGVPVDPMTYIHTE